MDGRFKLIQTSTPITHGSSGGGLFDVNGNLLAITSGTFAQELKDRHANINKCIPVGSLGFLTNNLSYNFEDFHYRIVEKDLLAGAMQLRNAGIDNDDVETIYRASELFFKYTQKHKTDPFSHFRLGECLYHVGRKKNDDRFLEAANNMFKISVLLDSTYYPAYGLIALSQLTLGDYSGAKENADKLIKIAPQFSFSNYVMGYYYNQIREYQDAIFWLTKAINLGGNVKDLHQWHLERAIARSWLSLDREAEEDFLTSISLSQNRNQDAFWWLAHFYLVRGKNYQSCDWFIKLNNINPSYRFGEYELIRYVEPCLRRR